MTESSLNKLLMKKTRKAIEEKTAKNEMANQRNLFKVFIDETNEDTVCEFFREFVERFNVWATDTHKDEYVIFRD